jgi:two-component system chemotaxis response regulator CheB
MSELPTPVVVVTSLDPKDAKLVYRAMEAGALEVVGKPPPPGSAAYDASCQRLTRLVRTLSDVPMLRRRPALRRPSIRPPATVAPTPTASRAAARDADQRHHHRMVVIGASTGGPPAVRELLDGLPNPMPLPVVLVQHMLPEFLVGFATWLASETGRKVEVVTAPTAAQANTVYVAPGDRHLEVFDGLTLRPTDDPPLRHHRPAVDRLFESAAQALGDRVVAVLLTGMGDDGARGLLCLHDLGALTIAQDPDSCAVPSMPRSAVDLGAVDLVLSPRQIGREIEQRLHDNPD